MTGTGFVMDGDRPPWPEPWTMPRPIGGYVGIACFGLIAVAGLVAGASLLTSGPTDPRAFVLLALVPLACGIALLFGTTRLGVRSRKTTAVRVGTDADGRPAMSVPFHLPAVIAFWLSMIGALPLLLLVVAVAELDAYTPGSLRPIQLVVGIVALVIAVPPLGLAVDGLRGKTARGELLLSPNGIRYRALGYDAELDWADVQGVSVASGASQPIVISGYTNAPPRVVGRSWLLRPGKVVRAQTADAVLVVRALALSIDPALAFHTVRYYFVHPAARAELGTETAVRRVRDGDVITIEAR